MHRPRVDVPDGPALYLLGGVAVEGVPAEDAVAIVRQSKVVALLACLALTPSGTFMRRDRIAGMLWPELDQAHARGALRKAVHAARGVLGEAAIESGGDEELALAPPYLWVDVSDLRDSITRGRFARAVDLYRGDLMPGFFLTGCAAFDEWLEEQRASVRDAAVAACWTMAQHLETGNQGTDASRYAKKVTRLDKSNERLLRRAMQMLDRLGDRAGALSIYDEFRKRLKRDLDAEPSPETVLLAESIRSGRSAPAS